MPRYARSGAGRKLKSQRSQVYHQMSSLGLRRARGFFSDEFFKMQQFYLRSISPVLYFTENFDVNCDWNSAEMAGQAISKAKVQIMRDDFKKEMEEKSKEYVDRMNNIIEYLSLTS